MALVIPVVFLFNVVAYSSEKSVKERFVLRSALAHEHNHDVRLSLLSEDVSSGAAQESEIPSFKGSDLGHFPLVSADFWTSDHLSERSRSVDAYFGTRARGTLTLKRR